MNDVRYRTEEVARFADVTLRQLQLWEEKRVAVASRSGRVRLYTSSQTLFVILVAELRPYQAIFPCEVPDRTDRTRPLP